jgi:hypothetical protein
MPKSSSCTVPSGRSVEGRRDLGRDAQCFGHRQRAACDPLRQRFALDQLQHQRVGSLERHDLVQRGDVRLIERRQHLRLAFEARQALRVAHELFRQQLQRDFAPEARIARAIDLAHAAGTEQFQNFEAPEARSGSGHRSIVADR